MPRELNEHLSTSFLSTVNFLTIFLIVFLFIVSQAWHRLVDDSIKALFGRPPTPVEDFFIAIFITAVFYYIAVYLIRVSLVSIS